LLPPLSPFKPSDLRVFSPERRSARFHANPSSPALPRHLGVLTFHKPPPYLGSGDYAPHPVPVTPRFRFLALQHMKSKVPFPKHPEFSPDVPKACLAPEKSRPQGLATLSTCLPAPYPVEASFSPQRSWASPFRALLLPRDRKKVSLPLSAPALPCETSRPRIGASAASSPLKSRTPFSSPAF